MFVFQLTVQLSTNNILEWIIFLHDPHHLTRSQLMLYGKDIIVTPCSTVTGSWTQYSVDLIEVIHVNQNNDPCTPEGGDVRNIWDCITNHMHSDMNCTLPWMPRKLGPMCSSPTDYDLYYDSIMGSIYHNTDHILPFSWDWSFVPHTSSFWPVTEIQAPCFKHYLSSPDAGGPSAWGHCIIYFPSN